MPGRWLAIAAGALAVGASVIGALLLAGDGENRRGVAALTPGFSGGELRPDAAVPEVYRPMIEDAAHGCAKAEVTPALIAAMLKAESDFDPDLRSPATDEYGIALWTPAVFEHWQVDVDGGGPSVFSAPDSIAAAGQVPVLGGGAQPSHPGRPGARLGGGLPRWR